MCSVSVPDVSLLDEHTGVVDGLGQTQLEHLSLQPALQEVLGLQTQHVIELHAPLLQHASPHQTTQQSVACRGEGRNVKGEGMTEA